uniref:F-box domain-containing protein n=1 Tax=Setaria italica TaxID=4555 RepID=K3Z7W5_SETIT
MDAGEDCISGLPDELLHAILVRLGSTRAAVRTGVLSRRWRHVWASLPELVLEERVDAPPPPASFLDTVDAALAACDAPALERLSIALRAEYGGGVLAGRIEPWLRFASERVVGALFLYVPPRILPFFEPEVDGEEAAVLELPASGGVTGMDLSLGGPWRLRPPSSGFELTSLVCTQCPCLRDPNLLIMLVDASNLSVRSESLQSLWFSVWKTRQLEIVASRLEKLSVSNAIDEARISALKLAELSWSNAAYDPRCHQFDDVGHRLRLLELGQSSTVASLMQQFDEVDELKLGISIPQVCLYQQSLLKSNCFSDYSVATLSLLVTGNRWL